ncbi:hypothetical protein F5148DRAFT_1204773 [Russula earlei]|uniref:Uncharacterized protein n=1 Tax=Russula earlei TaxID=71964 RepID=A0ACC0U7K1_9AGAM|nr:hypothetical protein F5148DRAFT_1204773 [Russula earlei]
MSLFSRRPKASPPSGPAPSTTSSGRRRGTRSSSTRSTGHAEDRSRSPSLESPEHSRRNGNGHSRFDDSGGGGGGSRFGILSRGLFRRRRPLTSERELDLANDQSLVKARSKVADAETAERAADAALHAARKAVREAKDQVKALDREAIDDVKIAKMKRAEVKNVRRDVRNLGRHG